MRNSSIALLTLVSILGGLAIWFGVHYSLASIRIAYAEDQTKIFEQMSSQASEAMAASPPQVGKAIDYLEYAHCYYPSGTKQVTGSTLDTMVERSRRNEVAKIISLLKEASGKDYGNDVQAWIDAHQKDGTP